MTLMKLSEVCTIRYGKDHKKLSEGTVPVYGSGGVMRHVEKSLSLGPSVLIPRKGTLGNLFYSAGPFWTVDTLFWTEIKQDIVEPKYLYYALRTKDLASLNIGTAVPSLSTDVLNEVELEIPEKETQKRIATLLGSIEDKIESNAKLNDYLAELLDAEYSRVLGGDCETKQLVDVVEILSGGTPKTKNAEYWQDGKVPFFAPGDVTGSIYTLVTEKHITELGLANCNSAQYPIDTVFLTARGTVGKVAMAGRPMAMNQSCFAFVGINVPQTVVYQVIKGAVRSLKAKANGATFAAINTRDLKVEEVLLPSSTSMSVYNDWALPIHEIMRTNEEESLRLAALRDVLLPKLMSGEIDVSKLDLMQQNNHLA